MNANKKVLLIVALGAIACLLSVFLSQFFANRINSNQVLLERIKRLPPAVEQLQLLSRNFVQNGDHITWKRVTNGLKTLRANLQPNSDSAVQWQTETAALSTALDSYAGILNQIHPPATLLNQEKERLKSVSLSFSEEVEEQIVQPYRKQEGERIYRGEQFDPFRIRVKETAMEMVRLHLAQQLILLELLVDWDLARYQNKKASIEMELGLLEKRLNYLNILMGKEPAIGEIINSLGRKLNDLILQEHSIFRHFTTITRLNDELDRAGDRLLAASEAFTGQLLTELSGTNRINQLLGWSFPVILLAALGILGTLLARNIIQFVEKLEINENNLRVTLDSIGDAVIATDHQGRITRMNPTAELLTGWDLASASGKSLSEVFHIINAYTRANVMDPAEKVLASGKVVGLANHTVLIAKDGQEYQIADSGSPIRAADGRIIGVVLVFRDVTESYAQEQRLRENEKRLRKITASVPGVVFRLECTSEGGYLTTFVGENLRQWFGLEPEPARFTQLLRSGIPAAEQERFEYSLDSAIHHSLPWHYQGRFRKQDGQLIWFTGDAIPYQEEDGTVFYGVIQDISQRKRMAESLQVTQFCFDKATLGIYRIGADGQILDVNESAASGLGYSREELSSLNIFDIDIRVNPENWVKLWKEFQERRSARFETLYRRKDGSETPVEINSNLLEYEGQLFAIAFVQDITERRKDAETLRQLRNYLSNIINSMPSVLVVVDRNERVTLWNRSAEQATGLSFEQVHRRPLAAVFPRLAEQVHSIETALNKREVIHESKVPIQQTDETQFEDITIFPLVANGVEGAVIRLDDVTERVRIEEIMIQSEKMLSVGGLAAGMAHEINNPLAGILQTAEVLANRLGTELPIPANEQAATAAGTSMSAIRTFIELRGIPRMLQAIRESGSRVAAIVENMLNFARKSDAILSSHSIAELIDKTLVLAATDYNLKKKYDFKAIEIRKDYADELPQVPCESAKIQQVILNLFSNAAQAMVEAGTSKPRITVRTRWEPERNRVLIEVEDNGPGMEAAIARRVFEPFFTTKPIGVGTGLGLSVSYFIVTENHGGEMSVESSPGKGARFIIRLPVKRETFGTVTPTH
ncbi:MAG: PAS domain S-box protein [Gammaproteobacteria bacterium]|nr:PAS domain S-box protein [Gammaproteobacteria bacterium]